MTNSRLPWLLALLCALGIVRWLVPPRAAEAQAASGAVVRSAAPAPLAVALAMPAVASQRAPVSALDAPDIPGDAFAARLPPPPPPAPPPPPPVKVFVLVGPPPPPVVVEPPPPPLPFQVIGTWDDGGAPGVFVSSPNGALIARAGMVLLAEYRVTAVSAQQVSFEHIASKRAYQLSIPRSAVQSPSLP